MRCFYEVLGVERTADLTELKKGYYKESLKWHPDKNSTQEATSRFQEIQEAYRVLSNAQERAWYDRHREQILRGGQGGIAGDYEEERLDVFQFFSRSCFEDYDDGPKGFYTVFRHAFEEIAAEEQRASAECPTSSSEESTSFPTFGKSDSDYDSVVRPFYTFWEGFATRKSYSWVERYDTRRLSSRIERRAAETENRKAREAAKKGRNEEVRQLVNHVRRRDRRLEAQRDRLAAAAKHAYARNQEQANKARQRNAADLEKAWAHEVATGGLAAQWADELEAELARIEAEMEGKGVTNIDAFTANGMSPLEEDDAYEDDNELYCFACGKSFASQAAKRNHETSKKHKEQVELLREALLEEERLALEKGDDKKSSGSEEDEVKLTKRAKRNRRRQQRANEEILEEVALPEAPINESNKNETINGVSGINPPNKLKRKNKTKASPKSLPNSSQTVCLICMEEFPSKNKLFDHIKVTGHAAIKAAPQTVSKKNKNKR